MTLLLIDGRNALYRFGFAMPKLQVDGTLTGAVYGFLGMLLRLKKKYPDGQFVVVWDGDSYRSVGWRRKIFSGYKQHSEESGLSEEVRKGVPIQERYIRDFCKRLDIPQAMRPEIEADDIIGILATRNPAYAPVVYSTDKDFLQLMPLGVTVIRDVGKRRMTPETKETVNELFRCSPSDVLRVRAFVGDSSDKIPGVLHGLGPVGASKLVTAGADPGNPKCRVGMSWDKDIWPDVCRNYRVMRIIQNTDDKELSAPQRKLLYYEILRIETLLFQERRVRTPEEYRAFLGKLADLELEEMMEKRQELWAVNV